MLFKKNILSNNTLFAIWKIEESVDELSKQLNKEFLLDSRYKSLKNETRKQEYLCTRLLIKNLLGEEKTIIYNEAGKPSLADNSYQLSISHTSAYVAVILHPTQAVGIDIEKRSERVLKLKEKFMSPTELEAIDKKQETLHTLLHWSAKETLFKILPETEIDFIEHLHIHPFIPNTEGSFIAHETRTNEQEKFEINYQVFEDFILTCSTK